jgi:hypothetical protein
MHAKGSFEVKNWDEQPLLDENGEPKATRAVVARSFDGDIAGEGTVEWLMGYRQDGTATFVGLERFVGRLGALSGSVLLQHTGCSKVSWERPGARRDRNWHGGSPRPERWGGFEAGLGAEGTRSFTLAYDV